MDSIKHGYNVLLNMFNVYYLLLDTSKADQSTNQPGTYFSVLSFFVVTVSCYVR